jgi:hypothetical protein
MRMVICFTPARVRPMRRSWTITLLEHEQPSRAAWSTLKRLVATWNKRAKRRFHSVGDNMWHVTFAAGARLELDVAASGPGSHAARQPARPRIVAERSAERGAAK